MSRFFLQMAGHSGTGKTTLARAIAEQTAAVRIDKDEIMASLMHAGVKPAQSGGIAYEVGFDLARSILAAGRHSVIFDSAAYFTEIREKGRAIASETGVPYRIIETTVPDLEVAETRINSRTALHEMHPSTLAVVDIGFKRPGTAALTEPHLEIDTSRPLDVCIREALDYLRP